MEIINQNFLCGITCAKIHIISIIINVRLCPSSNQLQFLRFNYMHFLFVTIFMVANLFIFLSCMRWCTVKAQNPLSRCCHAKVSNDVESQWCFPKGLRWLTNKLHTKTGMTKLKTLWNNTERAKYFIKLPPLYWFACETSSNYFVRTLQYDGWLLLLPSIYLERVYFNQFFFLAANRRALTYGNAMAEHHYNQTDSACLSFRVTMKKN